MPARPHRTGTIACGALALAVLAVLAAAAFATTYEVGPGKALASIGDVPWESIAAGDTVLIYWRDTPYNEKWVICAQGTAGAPITVRGVAGPGGALPVIDGDGATTRPALNFWNEGRGVLKIGGANVPADTQPQYITIENLHIRSGRAPYHFTGRGGDTAYTTNCAAIYVEKGDHLTIRNCEMEDCGNGFFSGSGSSDVLVDGCYIHGNGIEGSIYEHNNYTESNGITFQYNHFGALRAGCGGNNLKDRSAGLVVRYNWIEDGNRQLDLVDSDYFSALPSYRKTFVYGNILVEGEGQGNRQIVHYGGDSGIMGQYRKGTLYFYNNTVVSYRTDRTVLMALSSMEERADARNNIVYTAAAAGGTLALMEDSGIIDWSHNWTKPGWINTFGGTVTVNNDGTSLTGASPAFTDEAARNFHITLASACTDAATTLHADALPANDVTMEYVLHQSSEARPSIGTLDIGALEGPGVTAEPVR